MGSAAASSFATTMRLQLGMDPTHAAPTCPCTSLLSILAKTMSGVANECRLPPVGALASGRRRFFNGEIETIVLIRPTISGKADTNANDAFFSANVIVVLGDCENDFHVLSTDCERATFDCIHAIK